MKFNQAILITKMAAKSLNLTEEHGECKAGQREPSILRAIIARLAKRPEECERLLSREVAQGLKFNREMRGS